MSRDQYQDGFDEQDRRRGARAADDGYAQDDEREFEEFEQRYDRDYEQDAYEDAADEQQPFEDDEIKQLETVLNYLRRALSSAKPAMLKGEGMCVVNVPALLDMVNNIQDIMPSSIQYAQQVIDEREKKMRDATAQASALTNNAMARADSMIAQATQRAQDMLDRAREEAEQIRIDALNKAQAMVEDQEILRQAKEEANRIYNDARAKTSDEYRKAKEYVDSLLEDLERNMLSVLDVVRKSRKNIGGQ